MDRKLLLPLLDIMCYPYVAFSIFIMSGSCRRLIKLDCVLAYLPQPRLPADIHYFSQPQAPRHFVLHTTPQERGKKNTLSYEVVRAGTDNIATDLDAMTSIPVSYTNKSTKHHIAFNIYIRHGCQFAMRFGRTQHQPQMIDGIYY